MEKKDNQVGASSARQEAVFSFLGLEAIALIVFGFAGATGLTILRAVAVCLALFLYPLAKNRLSLKAIGKADLLYLIPIGLLPFFLSFSSFHLAISGSSVSFALDGFVTCLGFFGVGLLGFLLSLLPRLKKVYILYGVVGAMALLVLITFLYSLFAYGPFYTVRYAGRVYYYDGVVFPIESEGKFLDGFTFVEVTLYYAKTASVLLACSGVGLFALFFNRLGKKEAWALGVSSSIGLLDLIFAPFLRGLLIVFAVYVAGLLVVLVLKQRSKGEERAKKVDLVCKILFFVLLGLVVLGLILLFVDSYLMGTGDGFLRNLPLIGSYFEEGGSLYRLEASISDILFSTDSADRRYLSLTSFLFGAGEAQVYDLRLFEFQILYQNGFIAFALLLYFVFFFIVKGYKALTKSDGENRLLLLCLLGLALGGFLYLSVCDSEMPLKHPSELDGIFSSHSSNVLPFTRSSVALLFAFIFGVVYCESLEGKEAPSQAASSTEESEYSYQEVKIDE